MATKTSAAAVRRSATPPKESVKIVVRRGASRRFNALQNESSELPVVVTWDRREDDRRIKPNPAMEVPRNRRATDRRQKPPFTWDLADFVVVCPTPGTTPAPKKKGKKR
jgi:hypothetical protein